MIRGVDGSREVSEQILPNQADKTNPANGGLPAAIMSPNTNTGPQPQVQARSQPNAQNGSNTNDPDSLLNAIILPLFDSIQAGDVSAPNDVNFAALTSTELGAQAADAANTIGSLALTGMDDDAVENAEGTIAGIRNQLKADGATSAELAEFDAAVINVAVQSDPAIAGSPDSDPALAAESGEALRSASLGAFQSTDAAREQRFEAATLIQDTVVALVSAIAMGDVPPGNDTDLSESSTAELGSAAAIAADRIGRLIGKDGSTADTTMEQADLAAIRNQLIENGASPEQIQRFDNAVGTLAVQRAFAVSQSPGLDQTALIESRNALQSGDFLTLPPVGSVENRISAALEEAFFADEPIADSIDFSSSDPAELGGTAAQAADRLGRLIGQNGSQADIAEVQRTFASLAQQMGENGVNPVQFFEFLAAVSEVAQQRARSVTGSPLFDETALRENRNALQSGDLPALSDPNPDIIGSLTSAVESTVAGALTGDFEPPVTTDVSRLDDEEIAAALIELGSAIPTLLLGFLAPTGSIVQNLDEAKGLYGAIRNQLEADGATPEQLAELDAFITDFANEVGPSILDPARPEPEIFGRASELFGPRETTPGAPNGQIAAIAQTNGARDERLDPRSSLDADDKQSLSDVISRALAGNNPNEFADGDLSLALPREIGTLFLEAAELLADGIVENDAAATEEGLGLFDNLRDELVRRSPFDEIPAPILDAFERRIASGILSSRNPNPDNLNFFLETRDGMFESLSAINVEGNFGIARTTKFEGDNGAESASIFVIELKSEDPNVPSTTATGHDLTVTNVIEEQLQEAGQSYELTNILADNVRFRDDIAPDPVTRGFATLQALNSVTDTVQESGEPAFVNISTANVLTAEFLQTGLQAVSDTDLIGNVDLSIPITQDNIDDYAGVIRDVALASLDPERPEIITALGDDAIFWQDIGAAIQTFERAAGADIDIFVASPNDSNDFNAFWFADDSGLSGSITRVASNGLANTLESDNFTLPGQGEELPTTDEGANGIPFGEDAFFYRGGDVDVFAPGLAPSGLNGGLIPGASFSTPDMLVNAVLGRFNPDTETRTGAPEA